MKHNWTYKKLKDICGIQYGYPFDSHCFTEDSSFPALIRIRDVVRGFSETYYKGSIPDEYYVKAGEYLIGMDGEFNIAPWRSEKALLNQRVCKIFSTDSETEVRFVYYSLIKILKQIEDETPSVTVKHLSAKRLNQIELPIPSLDEQQAIVREVDGINHLIDLQEEQLREYDRLAQSLFYTTFGDPITNPKGWEKVRVDSICKNLDNRRKPVTASERVPGDIPYYGASGVVDYVRDYIFDGDYLLVSEDGANLVARVTPIAFSISGKTWVNNHAHILEFSEPSTQLYVQTHLNLIDLSGLITGAVQPKLNQAMLNGYMLPLPPLAMQQTFAAQIEAIEQQKALIRRSLDETRTLLAARMQYYFE